MRLLPLVAAAVLFGCGAAHAQSAMTTSGLGATSPLGMLGSNASTGSNGGTGIPLGATEIDPGGLSPGLGAGAILHFHFHHRLNETH